MNINDIPIRDCTDEQIRRAFRELLVDIGDQAFTEALTLLAELERRAANKMTENTAQ